MNRSKIKVNFIMMMVTVCLWISSSFVAILAEEDEKEAVIYLKAVCSEGIEIKEGDIFEITYKLVDGEDSAKIIVDAYDILDEELEVVLPIDNYEVINLEYKGSNPAIIEYGIESAFCSDYRDKLPIIVNLAIGTEKTEYYNRTYRNFLCINGINDHILIDENGEASFYEDRLEEQLQLEQDIIANNTSTQDNTDMYTEDEMYSDNYGVEEQLPSSEEPKIELYTTESTKSEETKEDKSNIIRNFIIFVIVAVIILLCIFFLFKKNTRTRR